MFLRMMLCFFCCSTFFSFNAHANEEQLHGSSGPINAYIFRTFAGNGVTGVGFVGFDLNNPNTTNTIRNSSAFLNAHNADFLGDDFSILYLIKGNFQFVEVDVNTGLETSIGSITLPDPNDLLRGLTWDAVTNQFYLATLVNVYTIDPIDASLSFIGSNTGRLLSGLAADSNGDLYSIDLSVTAQSNQALDFDHVTGILYWSGCSTITCGTLRTIDITTGNSTLYDSVGSTSTSNFNLQYGGFALATVDDLIFANAFE